jgi:peptide/nickel transport system substrate-binding protein
LKWHDGTPVTLLRNAFVRESDVAKQKELAEKVQLRAIEIGTHAWLGQWEHPIAYRKDRVDGWIEAPVTVFWNVKKRS